MRIKRRRTRIRLLSFVTASFAVAVGLAVTGMWMAYGLRMNIEYSYERSLSELSDHMNNIDVALQKAQYAGTSAQLVGIAGEITTESVAAKDALSQIQVSNVNFENTSKFISQVGDYASSLSRSVMEDHKLSSSDYKTISSLNTNSSKLSTQLSDIVSDVQTGRLTLFKSSSALNQLGNSQARPVSTIESGFQNIEENLSGLPSLIYDGPFSDNMLKQQPSMTQGKPAVNREVARRTAAGFLGIGVKSVADDGETAGSLPTYNFKAGTSSISVSKNGGYVVRMLDSRVPAAAKLDAAGAAAKADAFLKQRNIAPVSRTYYLTDNNTCVINYAYMQGDVICYPDLIKVGIALDNGGIASFDATGYLMNHTDRKLPKVVVSEKKAQSLLSPALTVKKVSLALIPRQGVGEALCYEFKCTADKGTKNIIDYFNVTNGVEEQLLILTNTPGGTLAM